MDVKELAKEVGEGLSELEGRLTELKTVKNKAKRQRSRRELNEVPESNELKHSCTVTEPALCISEYFFS